MLQDSETLGTTIVTAIDTGSVPLADVAKDRWKTIATAVLGNVVSPTAFTGNVNNYNPAGLSAASLLRIDTGGAARTITGIVAPPNAGVRSLVVGNRSSAFDITLTEEDVLSVAENRFLTEATIPPGGMALLVYDPGTERWRVIATSAGTASGPDWSAPGAGTIHTDNYIEGGPGTDTTAIHTPGTVVDDRLVRFDGTTGTLVQQATAAVLSDTDQLSGLKTVTNDAEYDNGNQSTTWTWNCNNGQFQKVTLTGSTTSLTITPPTAGVGRFQLTVIQGGTGSYTIAWPTAKWINGGTPVVLTTAVGGEDIITGFWNGTGWRFAAGVDFQ